MKKNIQSSLSTSLLAGGLMLAQGLQANGTYDPGAVAAMPQDTMNFINRLNSAGQQAAYLQSLPNSSRGMRGLETYYRNRHEHFMTVLNHNLTILEQAHKLVAQASVTGGPDGRGLSDCLGGNGSMGLEQQAWRELKKSFEVLGQLRQYAETSVGNYFPGAERPQLSSNVTSAFSRVGSALDFSNPEGSFWQPINSCCARIGSGRSQYPVCNESYIEEKLTVLAGIKKLPSQFVDPMNPGPYAPSLSTEDMVDLMSLGQMQDFIHAKDFNSQAMALIDADARCTNSREEAMEMLKRKGETRALIQTAIPALQCSLGTLLRNSNKTVRQIGMGIVSAKIPMFTTVSECSPETIAAAQTTLFYSPEAFRADFEHLTALPTNMLQSQPIAKPIEVYENDGLLVLDLRDEAGFTREMIYIGDGVSPEYAQMQAAASRQALGQSAMQVVNNGTITPDGTNQGRVAGRSLVNGVGATRGDGERVLVRELSAKASDGDLEAARTLAGAVRGRKNQLKDTVKKASTDRALISSRKEKRATEARGVAERAIVQEATAKTAQGMSRQLASLREAIGLSSDSGRVVERPGGSTGSTSSNGSTVTSNLPAIADRAANQAYKEAQAQKAIVVIRGKIREMANNILEVAKRLNNIIEDKKELEQKIAMMADANTYKKIDKADFDDRPDIIMRRQDEIVRMKKEYYALNAQELGAKAVLATAKGSFLSYLEGAKSFQGLDVRRGDIRAPASIQQPLFGQQGNTSLFQMPTMPTVPGAVPPNLAPPMFNPTPTGTPVGSIFPKWFELFSIPMAHANPLTKEGKRQRLLKEFDAFLKSYNDYAKKVDSQVVGLKQQAWERFIINEREMRKEPLLSGQERIVLRAFNDTVREEVPELIKAKVSGNLSKSNNMQLYQYIDQIRADAAELNELVIQEATLAKEAMPRNVLLDDEVMTGILPAIALD